MKKIVFLCFVTVLLGGYTYFFQMGVSENQNVSLSVDNPITLDGLEELYFFQPSKTIRLKMIDDFWWIRASHSYPADQHFIEKILQIMSQAPVVERFPLKKDRYGFDPGKAFAEFIYKDGLRKRYKIGEMAAPRNSIFVLDIDANMVFVFHNVWGQAFYYPIERFYSPFLPIAGKKLKKMSFFSKNQLVWALKSSSQGGIVATKGGEQKEFSRADWLWFFKQFGEFKVTDLEFEKKPLPETSSRLNVETEKSNIDFLFDQNRGKIYVPSLKASLNYDKGAFLRLKNEFDKVFESDKK